MSTSSAQQPSISLEDLDLPQLQQVKSQLEEEISHLTGSFTKLRQAQATFSDCLESLNSISPSANPESTEGKSILVPLTSSLYVSGTLSSPGRVIVDVGTGYYVEKSSADAKKFYQKKVNYLKQNLETLQATVTSKQNNLRGMYLMQRETGIEGGAKERFLRTLARCY